jgi:hypothetical protein
MPTYGFLQHEMGEPDTISTEDNINNFLLGLNSDSHRFDRMGLPSSTDKVKTRVYYCGSKDTIKNIDVKPTTISNEFPYDFYEDGQPRKDPKLSKMGDGTVPDHSAKLPCDDIVVWAECPSRDADHTSLIAKYHRDIADDLYADVEQNVAQARGSMAISQANDIFNRLMISVNGRVQPHIVDPQGMSVGISPISGTIDTAPATTLKIEPDSGFIAIDNPIDGNYVLSLKSLYSEDCRISIAFTTDSGEYVVAYAIFFYPGVFSISFNLSSGSQAPIVISHQPEAPGGLMADAVEQDGLKTTLSWNPSDDPLVTGYRIYARYIDDPFLKLIGSSASTSYFTGESWASNSSIKKRLYAVTGMRPDGSESFLSDTVTNDDRDHDGLSDVIETSMGTFVDDPDSDGDKWTDGDEVLLGADPLDPESSPCFGDSEPDGDVDGSDLFEFIVGIQNSNIEKFALSFGRTGCQ